MTQTIATKARTKGSTNRILVIVTRLCISVTSIICLHVYSAAICAAPYILGELGFLKGREATVFPGFEDKLEGAKEYTRAGVVTDGHITTARGMGVAIDLGLELVSLLKDKELADEVAKRIQLV